MGVGYGAHIVLNQPLDIGDPFGEPVGAGGADPWAVPADGPQVTWNNEAALPAAETVSVDVQLATTPSSTAIQPESSDVQQATAVASTPWPPTDITPPAAEGQDVTQAEPQAPQPLTPVEEIPSEVASSYAEPAGQVAAQASDHTPPIADATPIADPAATPPLSLEMVRSSAENKLAAGELAEALFVLSVYHADPAVPDAEKSQIQPLLDQLAGSVIYSREHLLEPAYQVQPGETLDQVATRYDVPPMVLARINRLTSPYSLMAGEQLKVIRGPFQAQLRHATGELTLYLNRYYAGRFNASVSNQVPDQEGTWLVSDKREQPPYQDPQTGQLLPPGDPQNPWGLHWIGLVPEGATQVQCALHGLGSGCPECDPRGYIALRPQDADDLYTILSVGSTLTILR